MTRADTLATALFVSTKKTDLSWPQWCENSQDFPTSAAAQRAREVRCHCEIGFLLCIEGILQAVLCSDAPYTAVLTLVGLRAVTIPTSARVPGSGDLSKLMPPSAAQRKP